MGLPKKAVVAAAAAVATVSGFGLPPASATAGTVTLVGAASRNDSASNGEGEVPYGIPTGVRVGDLLILQVSIDGNPTVTQARRFHPDQPRTVDRRPREDLHLLQAADQREHRPGKRQRLYLRHAFVNRSGLRAATVVVAFRGENRTRPILSAEAKTTDGTCSHDTISVGGVVDAVDGAMLVAGIGAAEGSTLPSLLPVGFTVAAASAPGRLAEILTRSQAGEPTGGVSAPKTSVSRPAVISACRLRVRHRTGR